MESKQMTLRSQTVRCPHCGEYYSVTYKYCPFCDAGRKAEERKKAARKQQATSLFTGLFSGKDDDGMDAPVRESGQHRERQGGQRSEHGEGESRSRQRPVQYEYDTPIPRSEGFRKKKTSEMTEEEKRAYRAEREARAAARKRERDRAARAASLTELNDPGPAVPAEEAPASEQSGAGPVLSPSGMETIELTIDPMRTAPADLAALATQAANPAENGADGPQADGGAQAGAPGLDAMPVVEVPTPTPEVTPKTYDPSRILEGDSELDALLSEIRGLLDGNPSVPAQAAPANAAQAEAPVQTPLIDPQPVLDEMPLVDAGELIPEEPAVSAGPAEGETAPAEASVPAGEEVPQAVTEGAQAAAEVQEAAAEAQAAVNETQAAAPEAQPAPAEYEDPELIWSTEPPAAAAVPAAEPAETAEPVPGEVRQRRSADRQARQRKKQKAGIPLLPIIAAVAVVIVAAILVSKVIVPALTTPKEAETITLAQTQVTLTSPDATETLTPVFEPKGSTGEIKWTCSNWGVVDVNPEGLLTAKAPGTALVAATLPNGSSATVDIVCAWGDEWVGEEAGGEAAVTEGEAAVETAGLSATDLTLDAQGDTQQLTLGGVTGSVTWSSSKPSVATVSADGTVTAVNKGSATITAEANGSKYNCNVRCVW